MLLSLLPFGLLVFLAKSNGYGYEDDDVLYYDTFPEDFQWGYATASYQVLNFNFITSNHMFSTNTNRSKGLGILMGKVKIFGTNIHTGIQVKSTMEVTEILHATVITCTRRMSKF